MIRHAVTVAALLLALAATVGVEEHRLDHERSRSAAAALAATNMAAERDSTRDLAATNERVAQLFGDSIRLVEKLVVQKALHADAVGTALAVESRGRYALQVALDSLRQVAAANVERDTSSSIRQAYFDLRHPPYTIEANVEVPTPPDSARITIAIRLDTIHVDARLSCSSPNTNGARIASIVASSPPWASVRFDRVEQVPDVCASAATRPAQQPPRRLALAPLFIGAGYGWAIEGRGAWRLFVGTGLAIRI